MTVTGQFGSTGQAGREYKPTMQDLSDWAWQLQPLQKVNTFGDPAHCARGHSILLLGSCDRLEHRPMCHLQFFNGEY